MNNLKNQDLEINEIMLQKAIEASRGEKTLVTEWINQSLRQFINISKLEAMGFKEISFCSATHLGNRKIFAKPVAKLEIKHDINEYMYDPNFCGVIYPTTILEVFVTPKSHILIQKSIDREIHFCNGTIIFENKSPRAFDLQIINQADRMGGEYPDSIRTSIAGLKAIMKGNMFLEEFDEDFINELEV